MDPLPPVIEWARPSLGGAVHSDLTRSVPVKKRVRIECEAGNGRRDILRPDEPDDLKDAVVS
jgi:hypothetical protein